MQKSAELIEAQKRLAHLRKQRADHWVFNAYRPWRRYFLTAITELRAN